MLQPLYCQEGRHWIGGACVISRAAVGDVASCILYFSSISIFWQYMTAYKQQVCHAVWRCTVWAKSHFCICTPLIRNITQNELSCVFANRSGKHMHLYKHMAVIRAVTWVGTRNVLCYGFWICPKSAGGTVTSYKHCEGLIRQCLSQGL